MWVLIFQGHCQGKGKKEKKTVFSVQVRSIDLASLVEAVYIEVSYYSSSIGFRDLQHQHRTPGQVEPSLAVRGYPKCKTLKFGCHLGCEGDLA